MTLSSTGALSIATAALDAFVDWSSLPRPCPGLRAVVVVPARNEGLLMARTLQALVAQVDVPPGSYEVLVLANNCSDDTADRARDFTMRSDGRIHVVDAKLPPPFDNVGAARRALMECAAGRLEAVGRAMPKKRAVILSTDGDSRVDRSWLKHNLAAIDAGADAVGGRIHTDIDPSWSSGLVRAQRLDGAYCLLRSKLKSQTAPDDRDPWPRHHQHFGASLAITLEAYRRVGGLPRVAFLEDAALVRELRLHDCAVRHAPHVRVRTSGRLDGRAEVGLSWQLRQWADERSPAARLVPDPADEARWWALRHRSAQAWRQRQQAQPHDLLLGALAGPLGRSAAEIADAFIEAPTFGALWQQIVGARREAQGEFPKVPLIEAMARLRTATTRKAQPA